MMDVGPDTARRAPWGWWVMTVLAVGVALYAVGFAVVGAAAFYEGRTPMIGIDAAAVAIAAHAGAGTVALGLGPFQFLRRLRAGRPAVHRALGRVAVVAGIATGLSGLFVATFAEGGAIGRIGFAALGVSTAVAGMVAWRRILAGDVDGHRRWMVRSFALLLGAVSLRLQLPFLFGLGLDTTAVFAIVAWSCWVPNAIAVEWWWARRGLSLAEA